MPLIRAIIYALLTICMIVLGFYLILWVLATIGLAIPAMVITIIKVMLVLVAILILIELFSPWLGGFTIFRRTKTVTVVKREE